jgi:hypothetical protein
LIVDSLDFFRISYLYYRGYFVWDYRGYIARGALAFFCLENVI